MKKVNFPSEIRNQRVCWRHRCVRVCWSMQNNSFQSIMRKTEHWRWEMVPFGLTGAVWEPLMASSASTSAGHICQGCKSYRPAEVLCCALAVTVCRALSCFLQTLLWWLPPAQWTSMQGLQDVLDVGHSNFGSTHPLRASNPLSTGLWSPLVSIWQQDWNCSS